MTDRQLNSEHAQVLTLPDNAERRLNSEHAQVLTKPDNAERRLNSLHVQVLLPPPTHDVTLAGTISAPTWTLVGAYTLTAPADVALAGSLSAPTWTLTGAYSFDPAPLVSFAGELAAPSWTLEGDYLMVVDTAAYLNFDGALAAPTWTLVGSYDLTAIIPPADVTLDGDMAAPSWTLTGSYAIEPESTDPAVSLDGTLAAPVWVLSGSYEIEPNPATDTSNRVNGLHLSGYAVCPWDPPVAAPPASLTPAHAYEVARAHSVPVLSESRPPVFTVTTAKVLRHLDRIIVGNRDLTYWRGVHTPTPDYDQIDPLLYGAGVLHLPQVHALFERPGEGALSFLAKGKRVIVQRVDAETGEVVSADDYRGFISDYDIDGNSLTLILGGEVSGRMSMRWHPTPAWKSFREIGRMIFDSFWRIPGRFTPFLGPVTGIELPNFGGVWTIDYVSEVLAKAVQTDGDQWTVGRRADGTWGMWIKDRETIDATIYFDDSAMKPQLKQSLSEEHDRVFVTAVAKDGRRINFRVYPGLRQGPPPPYPTTGPFGQGTTNDDLDNPEDRGIDAMIHRLVVTGYLSRAEAGVDYLYDADVTRAIRRLQDDTGLAETGDMNLATWKKLYDLDATGHFLAGTTTLPAAQDPATRMWNRTASGALSVRNPLFDPHKIVSDLPLSMGSVKNRQKARELAKAKLSVGGDWIGTVECHLALIRGEHNPDDPLTEADIMPPRELRPNMNVWAPLWDGGTLFHVSGINVRDRGKVVTPALDTRARPSMEAWEVIQRNAESRKHPTRLWINEYRGSRIDKDGGEWDDVAGLVDDRVRLRGGHWTSFPIVAGQEGIVRSLRTRTSPAERYAMAIFGRRVGARDGRSVWLDRMVPNPLLESGSERWDKPAIRRQLDDRILLYTAGQFEQALGYFPGQETSDITGEATGHPVNGRWEDDAGFSYHTFAEPVLYVAIWVPDDTTLQPGRLMWDQFEQGA